MERLTEWNDEQTRHAYYPRCFEEPCYGGGCKINDCPFETAVCDRLAAYEDTGLSPEKVSWMKEVVEAAFDNDTSRIERAHNLHVADKEGRVIVLPCKGTDKLYVVGTKQIVECNVAEMYLMDDETIEYLVNFECVDNCDGCPFNSWERETVSDEYHCGGEYGDGSVSSKNFGKTVFLTREEAEKALAEMEGKKDGTA